MTLIELLISLVVLMLIVVPMTMVLQFAFASANTASHRTTDSAGAQLLSSYLVADVQAAQFVWTPSSATPFAAPFANQCGTADTRLELQSSDATTGGINAVTYDLVPPAGGAGTSDTAFARRTWSADSTPCTRTDSTTLVASIDTTSLPAVTCAPASCSVATSVRLHIDALSTQVHNSSLYTRYSFDLTGTRRAS